jgi:MoaA/NifB/PqqE/SkfB family radical SAM enzyme
MYNYEDIKSIHLEVTSKCQARCPMCPRRFNGGPMNPFITLDEITLAQFKSWFDDDFCSRLEHVNMCGNLGDPIIAKDTLKIFEYLRSISPDIILHMHTNGSARDTAWWERLAELEVKVIFGIDGLEDTHHLYRIGTDWHKIIENAVAFINAGGWARWDMLIFEHNEHQVKECRALSDQLGFADFSSKHTSRFRDPEFPVLDDNGKQLYTLKPTSKSISMVPRIKSATEEVTPIITCKAQRAEQIYVSASGIVSPCCWLDMEWTVPKQDSRIEYMSKIGEFPNLKEQTLQEIFASGFFSKISGCWSKTGLIECSKNCGSFDRLNEQFQ